LPFGWQLYSRFRAFARRRAQADPAAEFAALAKEQGDAARGAVVFFQQQLACAKCHAIGREQQNGLVPI